MRATITEKELDTILESQKEHYTSKIKGFKKRFRILRGILLYVLIAWVVSLVILIGTLYSL